MQGLPGVVVDRLELRVPAAIGTAGQRAALASLDVAAWPRSSEGEEAWLILRDVSVTARASELGPRAAAEAAALDAEAADGWRAGEGDRAVRFASRAELLARLSRDLATGQAARYWFWRSLLMTLPRGSPARAVAALWSAEPLRLLDVVVELERAGELAPVLRVLDADGARALLSAIATASTWRLPVAESRAAELPVAGVPLVATLAAHFRFSRLVEAVAAGPVPPAVVRLLGVLALWRHAPRCLSGGEAEVRLAIDELVSSAPVRSGMAELPPGPERPALPSTPDQGDAPPPRAPAVDGDHEQGPVRRPEIGALPDPEALAVAPTPSAEPDQEMGAPEPLRPTRPPELPEIEPQGWFVTPFGGLFFLLNALDQVPARTVVESSAASGWHWLWRLGIALGLEADAPLARFLADALDLPGPEGLSALEAPADEDAVLDLLARRYAPRQVWDAGLLLRPAVVRWTQTHLDIDMRLSEVRLDVRRAGLDVDPGWLPWLGRAVAFHYGTPPALAEPHL